MIGAVDVLRQIVTLLDRAGPGDLAVSMARLMIAECGVAPNAHCGVPPAQFTPQMTAEWCLGQLADVIDTKAWWAMNTGLNVCRDRLEEMGSAA
jgi:hypothetical protein